VRCRDWSDAKTVRGRPGGVVVVVPMAVTAHLLAGGLASAITTATIIIISSIQNGAARATPAPVRPAKVPIQG
jgi:hypothetical protein